MSKILALCIISASEIAKVMPEFTYDFPDNYPHEFQDLLWSLGVDIKQPIERQFTIQHKNRFGEVVICDRWVANERYDLEWIRSGYASVEAVDKSKNNRLLNDIYRLKGYVE